MSVHRLFLYDSHIIKYKNLGSQNVQQLGGPNPGPLNVTLQFYH